MANLPTLTDDEDRALNSLLDSFPSVSLDLIASAYTKADGDPNLAAELISCYTSDFSIRSDTQNLNPPANPPLSSQHAITGRKSQPLNNALPLVGASQSRLAGRPSQPQLLDYFPSSPEQNAWMAPLRERSRRNDLSQNELNSNDADQANDEEKFNASESEFPCLPACDVFSDATRTSLQSSTPIHARNSRKVSAASGLVINARTRRNGKPPSEPTSLIKGALGKADNPAGGQETISVKLDPAEIDAPEQLLLSKLGDRFQLGIEAVRDVLGHYHGDLEKSLEALLQMSITPSSCIHEPLQNNSKTTDHHSKDASKSCHIDQDNVVSCKMEKIQVVQLQNFKRQPKTTQAFEEEMLEQEYSSMKWVLERLCQEFPNVERATVKEALHLTKFNYSDAQKILLEADVKGDSVESDQTKLSTVILMSLFNARKEKDREESTLSCQCKTPQQEVESSLDPVWKVVSNSDSLSMRDEEPTVQVRSYGNWDDYERHHQSTKQHWQMMDCYFKAANEALASGDVSKAELLSEKGEKFKQLAVEARERASKYLLEFKTQENENDFILDLKEQHVNEALKLLRLHLKTLSPIPSCSNFTVITGPLNDGMPGQSKVKQAVVRYLEKREIEWVETSPFCLQVKLKKVQLEA